MTKLLDPRFKIPGYAEMLKAKEEFRATFLDTRRLIIEATDGQNTLRLDYDRIGFPGGSVLNGQLVEVSKIVCGPCPFPSPAAAEKFFRDQSSVSEVTIANEKGWCLYWKWNSARTRMRFRLFQFRVNGHPFALPGEAPDAIVFSWKASS